MSVTQYEALESGIVLGVFKPLEKGKCHTIFGSGLRLNDQWSESVSVLLRTLCTEMRLNRTFA